MTRIKVGCQLSYAIAQPSTLVFNIQLSNSDRHQILQETLQLNPQIEGEEYITPAGENRYLRLNVPPGDLQLSYQALVAVSYLEANADAIAEVPIANLPIETFPYLYPSRYCQSDLLVGLALSEFGDVKPGYGRVQAICDWIYKKVKYLSGSTSSQTSAYDTATQRAGVCRDFAHLGIAFCRALNIPARFVSTYAVDLNPPDFHACFEAYLGDRWYLFDATHLAPLSGIVRIGTGRDAADVSFATLFGSVQMKEMEVLAELVEGTMEESPVETEGKAIALTATIS